MRAVYLYYIYDEICEKSIFPVDYSKNEAITAGFLEKPEGRAYILCPEYTVVEAITTPDSDAAKGIGIFIPDEIYEDVNKVRKHVSDSDTENESGTHVYDEVSNNTVSDGEREVGGEPMFRIYEINPNATGSIRFVIHSSLYTESTEEWGGFTLNNAEEPD